MKIYFLRTNGNNKVILTDGNTAKIFDGAPTGKFLGVDLYAGNAASELKCRLQLYEKAGLLRAYESIPCDNEISYDEVAWELEVAKLIFENQDK